ncbi:MAG TPA: DUF1338 domain-containing protein [Planctomycetaceae bacterium]|nr:DUF1338 domain-containing protein [Planctomycetaceae bacterium]
MNDVDVRGPHAWIPVESARDELLARFLDRLWRRYRERVPYVRIYEELIASHGGTFVNDHIAFRTLACQQPFCGIPSLSRLFEAFGYEAAGCYQFPDKHLSAIHLQHPNGLFPKLFISELQMGKLPAEIRGPLRKSLQTHRPALSDELLDRVATPDSRDLELLQLCTDWIETLPWAPPEESDLLAVNAASQYGAWVLGHGYNVNHFTALINSQNSPALADIEQTVRALQQAGVPVKSEIEGAPRSKLRQTATSAAAGDITIVQSGRPTIRTWPYAYFELAERGDIVDSDTGRTRRFQGFLGSQATQLFEMTRRPQ